MWITKRGEAAIAGSGDAMRLKPINDESQPLIIR